MNNDNNKYFLAFVCSLLVCFNGIVVYNVEAIGRGKWALPVLQTEVPLFSSNQSEEDDLIHEIHHIIDMVSTRQWAYIITIYVEGAYRYMWCSICL